MTENEAFEGQSGSSTVTHAPLHRRIAENLNNRIVGGELMPGKKLPSERQIAHQFTASRATVRTALQHLEQEGLITRRDRRSAVVATRRDVRPSLRMAFSSPCLLSLFGSLGEKQILPTRSQLQLLDMRNDRSISQLVTMPASGADVVIGGIEYARTISNQEQFIDKLPKSITEDVEILDPLKAMFVSEGSYSAVPLGVSPMVLFYNRATMRDIQVEMPRGNWHWDRLVQIAKQATVNGNYGFQIRPTFGDISTLMTCFGGEMYTAEGTSAAASMPAFETAIRFVSDLIHESKVTPPLVSTRDIDLFADGRCAMTIGSFPMYKRYREKLGADLGVATLPGAKPLRVGQGYSLMMVQGVDNLQPIGDLLRNLLRNDTQAMLVEEGVALPARKGVLTRELLFAAHLDEEAVGVFDSEMANIKPVNMPASLESQKEVEKLMLELWMGLDNIDSISYRFKQL